MVRKSMLQGAVAGGILAALLLAACAGRDGDRRPPSSQPDPESPVSGTVPSMAPPGPDQRPVLVSPRPGLVDVRPTPWDKVEVLDERTIEVRFWSGVEECYGVDRVDVEYRANEVAVTVYQGRVPTAEACIEIAVLTAVRVTLDEPLAGRQIVEGAANV
jgi:hypothetical protein